MSDTPEGPPTDAPTPSLSQHLYKHPNTEPITTANTPSGEEAQSHVTLRKRNASRVERVADPIPATAYVLRPPKQTQQPAPRSTPSPHRPGPQISVVSKAKVTRNVNSPPEVPPESGALRAESQSGDGGKRGGARQACNASGELPPPVGRQEDSSIAYSSVDRANPSTGKHPAAKRKRDGAKNEKFESLQERAGSAGSLDELAAVFREPIDILHQYNSAPTKACFNLLEEIHERLSAHHEFPSADNSTESFSTIVSRSVVAPQKAIQSLSKTVESLKLAPLLAPTPAATTTLSYAQAAAAAPSPKTKAPPLPSGTDERILVRFDGPPPPIYHMRYDEIVRELNAHLAQLNLPLILFVQKQKTESPGLFIAPAQGKDGVAILMERWDSWTPAILPGCRVVPVVAHCFAQVDGIPFASVQSFKDLKREFEQLNPSLGTVVKEPRWKTPRQATPALRL
ncbi:hypothetical protein R3P38DRAFT_3213938 [Favolaschia claudopus]|uniref:Uncharacterized protein n=1 Tax=Favolaschia claudopus TaxID=2862362 RepID=A0AAW0AD65_9AGAR